MYSSRKCKANISNKQSQRYSPGGLLLCFWSDSDEP